MTILLLTGPPAAGKTTIAQSLASRGLERLAIIEVDQLRRLVVDPQRAPADGEEAQLQHLLGVLNACALAENFDAAGFDVVIVDLVTEATAARYREQLSLSIVRLLPNWEQTMIRSHTREEPLRFRERETLCEQQKALEIADVTIDNSSLAPNIVAERLEHLLDNPPPASAPQPSTGYHAPPSSLPPPL